MSLFNLRYPLSIRLTILAGVIGFGFLTFSDAKEFKRQKPNSIQHSEGDSTQKRSYKTKPKDEKAVQERLQKILNELRQPGDPEYTIHYVNSSSVNARIFPDGPPYRIEVFHGLINAIQNDDQLAGVIAHEMEHATTFKTLLPGSNNRFIQKQREEIIVADRGGMNRLSKSGRDPREYREFMMKLSKSHSPSTRDFFTAHGNASLRITALDSWLSENELLLPDKIKNKRFVSKELKAIKKARYIPNKPEISLMVILKNAFSPAIDIPKSFFETFMTIQRGTRAFVRKRMNVRARHFFKKITNNKNYKKMSPQNKIKMLQFAITHFPWIVSSKGSEPTQNFFKVDEDLINSSEFSPKKPGGISGIEFHVKAHSRADKLPYIEAIVEIASKLEDEALKADIMRSIVEMDQMFPTSFGFEELLKFENEIFQNKPILDLDLNNLQSIEALKKQRPFAFHKALQKKSTGKLSNRELIVVSKLLDDPQISIYFPENYRQTYSNLIPNIFTARIKQKQFDFLFRPTEIMRISQKENRPLPDQHKYAYSQKIGQGKHRIEKVTKRLRFSISDSRFFEDIRAQSAQELSNERLSLSHKLTLADSIDRVDSFHKVLHFEDKNHFQDTLKRFTHSPRQLLQAIEENESFEFHYHRDFKGDEYLAQKVHSYDPKKIADISSVIEESRDWSWSEKDIEAFMKKKNFWYEPYISRSDTLKENLRYAPKEESNALARAELKRLGFNVKTDTNFTSKKSRGFIGPAYENTFKDNENIQNSLYKAFIESNPKLKNTETHHRVLNMLLSKGTSDFLDSEAERLYLHPDFKCQHCLREVLDTVKIWDFEVRKKLYIKLNSLSNRKLKISKHSKADRIHAILKEIELVDQVFPEESIARAEVLESLANEIKANHIETRIIEAAKYGGEANHEGTALRFMSGFYGHLKAPKSTESQLVKKYTQNPFERQKQFIKFITDKGPPPKDLKDEINKYGADRLKRQFQALPPKIKALALNPLLTPPEGLYSDWAGRYLTISLATEGMTTYKKEARHLLNSLLYGLKKTAPFQETLALAYILGQSGSAETSDAQKLKNMLQALGNSGVSIGQKLRQRRLVLPEFYQALDDLQDQARSPTRFQIFELLSKILENSNVDEILDIEEKLGDASSKIVVRVRYKDGRISNLEDRALKILWENFDRSIEIETEKLTHSIEYLEKRAKKYRKLRSAVEAVQRGLLLQSDARVEAKHYPVVKRLYESGKVQSSGFRFNVIAQDAKAGNSSKHVNDFLAKGKRLKNLNQDEKKRVYSAIYQKDKEILFARPEKDGFVYFEKDRHFGNYIAELSVHPPTIHVFDYAQTTRISENHRNSLFKLIGLVDEAKRRQKKLPRPLVRSIADVLEVSLFENTKKNKAGMRLISKIRRTILNSSPESTTTDLLFEILADVETKKRRVHVSIYDYLEAMGNLEAYGEYEPKINGKSNYRNQIETSVRNSLDGFKPRFTTLEKCFLSILSKGK